MLFYGITDYLTYILGVIAIVLLPGPNSMYCLFVGSSQGIKQGYKVVAAIVLGDTLLMLAAVLGAATLLKSSVMVYTVFKAMGGLYLCYLGFNLLKLAYQTLKKNQTEKNNIKLNNHRLSEEIVHAQESSVLSSDILHTNTSSLGNTKQENVFLKAFVLSISNPKAILFFLSFFLQFVDPHYQHPMLSFFILGLTLQVISFLYLTVLIFSGIKLVDFFNSKQYLAAIGTAVVGLLFISFAFSLWYS